MSNANRNKYARMMDMAKSVAIKVFKDDAPVDVQITDITDHVPLHGHQLPALYVRITLHREMAIQIMIDLTYPALAYGDTPVQENYLEYVMRDGFSKAVASAYLNPKR